MKWTKVGPGTAKFFREDFLNIELCQLTKYQDKTFTPPDIKESIKESDIKIPVQGHEDVVNFRIHHQSTSSINLAMAKKGKKGEE